MSPADFLTVGILGPAFLIAAAVIGNFVRARRPQAVAELMPNRLMTRKPIVFVSPLRSPFYFAKAWNDWPEVLAEHGYEVRLLELPWSDLWLRRETLIKWKDALAHSHIVADPSSTEEIRRTLGESIANSVLVLKTRSCDSEWTALDRLSFRLHRAWCGWRRSDLPSPTHQPGTLTRDDLLERLQDLAEKDWTSFETRADIEA